MNQYHVSTAEVAMFRSDPDAPHSIEIGRHLLGCSECRAKLPAISTQEFRDCVLGAKNTSPIASEGYRPLLSLFPNMSFVRVTAFAGLSVLLGLGLYIAADRLVPADGTVARITEYPPETLTKSVPPDGSTVASLPGAQNETREPNVVPPTDPNTRDSSAKPEHSPIGPRKGRSSESKGSGLRTAETRGIENPCSNGSIITMESVSDENDIKLKWNAVRGAALYEIYIADLDENLLDHFESKSKTSYRSNLVLDSTKSYRWKLIITLKSGERIVGPPQVLKPTKGEVEKLQGSFEMRCVATK